VVPQDKWYAVERFGAYFQMMYPGLHWAGFDICGCCITFRSMTARVEQNIVRVSTKTKDNVFVAVSVAVQQSVMQDRVQEAMYKLTDVIVQVDAYVSDVVRSQIPLMTLDEAFEKKDDVSDAVQKTLQEEMANFGFRIHKALVTDLTPDASVMQSMNEINKQKRLRDASIMAAEAEKIKIVKAAEASADAAQLAGEGIARQRRAIIDGLRDSITTGSQEQLTTEKTTELMLITQYFETLKEVAAQSKGQTVFITHGAGAVADSAAQMRKGIGAGTPGQHRM
jgi:regulator of protease activity HflC (stomatin/prohibitin superfamily)